MKVGFAEACTIAGLHSLQRGIPLARLTTWRIGGPARFFIEPLVDQAAEVVLLALEHGLRVVPLGRGSNILVDDRGLDAVVMSTRRWARLEIPADDDALEVVAEAGVPMPTVAKRAAERGLVGFDFMSGIPGSVGGGVVMNAGLTAKEVVDVRRVLKWVDIVDARGDLYRVSADDLGMAYRSSVIAKNGWLVTRACFVAHGRAEPEAIVHRTAEHLAERRRKQPLSARTAGSTFKQPAGGKPAGWYIEAAGLKSMRVGGAAVSAKHANWIENDGSATSADVKMLVAAVQEAVLREFSVHLEREVRYLPDDIWGTSASYR